jgi:hypothetical protein
MATLIPGKSFGATELVTASNLDELVSNGGISGIVAADISSGAITDAKINDVSGAKLTTLSAIPSGAGDIPKANLDGDWDTDETLAGNSDLKLATQKATKTYADTKFPTGIICMWSGTIATIPTGWYLCNGSNGTPDLRNRFIIAADADDSGIAKSTITGSALQTHDTGLIPAHTHTVAMSVGGGSPNQSALPTGVNDTTITSSSYGTGTKVIAVFYALAYIMKA